MGKRIDLIGQHFGRLLALEGAGKDKWGEILWKCLCYCGIIKVVRGSSLRSCHTKSCCCLQRELTSRKRKLNLIGMRFGKLLVLEEAGKDRFNRVLWECRCDCDTIKVVIGTNLKNGRTKSCGCLQKELAYKKMLEMNPNYKHGLSNTRAYDNAISAKKKALKLNRTPLDADQEEIRKIYKICQDMNERAKNVDLLKKPFNGAWFHVDHIIPLSKNGLHHQDNLQILWWIDNLTEETKTIKKGGHQYPFTILFKEVTDENSSTK